VDKDEEFMTSILIGLRYQQSIKGFAMKSGGKIFFGQGNIAPSLYFGLGFRF